MPLQNTVLASSICSFGFRLWTRTENFENFRSTFSNFLHILPNFGQKEVAMGDIFFFREFNFPQSLQMWQMESRRKATEKQTRKKKASKVGRRIFWVIPEFFLAFTPAGEESFPLPVSPWQRGSRGCSCLHAAIWSMWPSILPPSEPQLSPRANCYQAVPERSGVKVVRPYCSHWCSDFMCRTIVVTPRLLLPSAVLKWNDWLKVKWLWKTTLPDLQKIALSWVLAIGAISGAIWEAKLQRIFLRWQILQCVSTLEQPWFIVLENQNF